MKSRFRLGLLALCVLVCSGLAQDCAWDEAPGQGLSPSSRGAGIEFLGRLEDAGPETCREACCDEPDCDLALSAQPADGRPQCLLVSCTSRGHAGDACVLQPNSQSQVYRKKAKKVVRREAGEDGERPHVEPLLDSEEPRTNETNNIRCRLPMKVGSCRAAFPKFYYDVTNQSCRSFTYGGCEANGNNFESQEECEAACSGVTGSVLPDDSTPAPPEPPAKAPRMAPSFDTGLSEDAEGPVESEPATTESVPERTEMSPEEYAEHCEVKPEVGPCRAAFQHWYYNSQTGDCQSFIYGGCKGNKNNYVNKESCMATCTVSVVPSSKKSSGDDGLSQRYKDECMATPDPGPCRAAFPRFYYDFDTGTCQSFMYGGCRGNKNSYGTEEECLNSCSIKDGPFDKRGRSRNRWTAAFFLFVTLAAISALLLVTLVVISVRRHRLTRRPSSISDKEELLTDEQSSVESLSVPESPKPNKA
ncbi:kunitz-type protease inhibitor 2 [Lates japonicus]